LANVYRDTRDNIITEENGAAIDGMGVDAAAVGEEIAGCVAVKEVTY